ncbi:hypothetical protein [Desulforamulus profundi]|uniref:hypothetical protein n=1 Tax=Desulforamulus profundi TaxID=1383067 RepID=UPI0030832B75
MIAFVLFQLIGYGIKIIINPYNAGVPLDPGFLFNLQFNFGHRRLLGGDKDIFQVQVFGCPPQVLNFKAFDLNLFDQALVVGIHRIQYIDQVVMLGVGGRVIEAEQRIEIG